MPSADAVLVDTGPLVALFDPSDHDHQRCKEALRLLAGVDLVTSIAVVTEATYLLGFSNAACGALLSFISTGAVQVANIENDDVARIADLMQRYRDLPMDFADATLVVIARELRTARVFTLDRRDFSVYRIGRRSFRLIPDA